MKDKVKPTLVLTLICVIASLLLVFACGFLLGKKRKKLDVGQNPSNNFVHLTTNAQIPSLDFFLDLISIHY